jgi:hypothetical protein
MLGNMSNLKLDTCRCKIVAIIQFLCSHYIAFIIGPILVAGLAGIGIHKLHTEDDFLKMWLPEDNYHRLNFEWLNSIKDDWGGGLSNKADARKNYVLVRSASKEKSVLTAEVVRKLIALREAVRATQQAGSGRNVTWEGICFRHKPEGKL